MRRTDRYGEDGNQVAAHLPVMARCGCVSDNAPLDGDAVDAPTQHRTNDRAKKEYPTGVFGCFPHELASVYVWFKDTLWHNGTALKTDHRI